MKYILIIIVCLVSMNLYSQSFNGQANIYRGDVKQKSVVYLTIEYNTLCISYTNGTDYSFKGVWKQTYKNEYRLYISDDMYWQFNDDNKLTLHETAEETQAVYVID